jgi:hypothetical protein
MKVEANGRNSPFGHRLDGGVAGSFVVGEQLVFA